MLAGTLVIIVLLGSAVRRSHLEKAGLSTILVNIFSRKGELFCYSTFVVNTMNVLLHIYY